MDARLTRETFAPHLDSSFRAWTGGVAVPLMLAEVSELRSSRRAEAFSIVFRGPVDAFLPQGEYQFEHDAIGAFPLFITPVGSDGQHLSYEAVFNRLREPQP